MRHAPSPPPTWMRAESQEGWVYCACVRERAAVQAVVGLLPQGGQGCGCGGQSRKAASQPCSSGVGYLCSNSADVNSSQLFILWRRLIVGNMSPRCLYEVLGVERDADDDALKKSYRKQALIWHPGQFGSSRRPGAARAAAALALTLNQAVALRPAAAVPWPSGSICRSPMAVWWFPSSGTAARRGALQLSSCS